MWSCVIVLLGISACAPDPDDNQVLDTLPPAVTVADAAAVAPNGETVTVIAIDNTFRDELLEIAAGTEVQWENRGRQKHNIVPVDDPEASSWGVAAEDDFQPGDTYAHVFTTPGTYPYVCSIHAVKGRGMIGTIVVSEP
jgi:plastocyanin